MSTSSTQRVSCSFHDDVCRAAYGPIIDTTGDQWDKIFDTNVKAAFMLSKEVIPVMREVMILSHIALTKILDKTVQATLVLFSSVVVPDMRLVILCYVECCTHFMLAKRLVSVMEAADACHSRKSHHISDVRAVMHNV